MPQGQCEKLEVCVPHSYWGQISRDKDCLFTLDGMVETFYTIVKTCNKPAILLYAVYPAWPQASLDSSLGYVRS